MKPSKEQILRALWVRGELGHKLRPEQRLLKELLEHSDTDLSVFNISRRFGKSTSCVTFCNEQAIRKPQLILYATAFLSDLQNFINPIFEWCLSDCPADLRPVWKASKKEYHFPNGSIIRLIGLDKNPNGLRGNAIDILVVDEAAFVKNLDYLYKSVIVPATMSRPFKLIFPSTPPESPLHFWSAELIPKAKERGAYRELTIDDISTLAPEEKQRLLDEVGGADSPTALREFYCKVQVDSTRAIAPSFNKTHVAALEVDESHIAWRLFGDSGAIDRTVFLRGGFSHEHQVTYIRDEIFCDQGITTSEIIAEIKSKWGTGYSLLLDATKQLQLDYSAQGLSASLPPKDDFGAGILLLNNELHNNRVVIHPDCKMLISTLENGLLTPNRQDYTRSKALGHCDMAATCIYLLRGTDKVTDLRPRPAANEVFSATKYLAPQHANLRKMFK